MKKIKMRLFALLIMPSLLAVNAQKLKVTGTVKVMNNDEPLIGVNIIIKGTLQGTITDINGNYQLEAEANDTLVFSYLGYLKENVPINGRTKINVDMVPSLEQLAEFVVIGYGVQKKSDLTGSVSSVSGESFNNIAVSNINQALQGKASGIEIINNSGAPGSSMTMRIRGMGTLNSGAEPLYVIDGFIQGDQSFGKGNGERPDNKTGIAFLDPGDVESVEILKDASAAAIYGARGANGVILITTKKGKKGAPKIDLDVQYGMQYLPHKIDLMNGAQYRNYRNSVEAARGKDTLDGFHSTDTIQNFDWQNFIFEPAAKQKYKVSISGGTDKTTYLVSGSYFDQRGIVDNSGLSKYSIRINTDQKIGKRFKTGQNIIVSYSERQRINENGTSVNGSPIASALKADPTKPPYYTQEEIIELGIDEELNWGHWRDLNATSKSGNPASSLDRKEYDYSSLDLFGTAFIELEILPSLIFKSNFGISANLGHMEEFNPAYQINSLEKLNLTVFRMRNEQWINWDLENTITYSKIMGKHNLSVVAGLTAQKEKFVDTRHSVTGFPYLSDEMRYMNITDINTITELGSSPLSYAIASILGRAIYSYDNKYLLTASIRRDGSSYFAKKYRYGVFPSLALGYKLSEEKFMEPIKNIINLLKIRAGYGELGNANIRPYLYIPLMTNAVVGAVFGNPKTFYPGAIPEGISNDDAKWERTIQKNIAVDLAFWQNKLTFSFDLFRKTTKDLLIELPMPSISGLQNYNHLGAAFPPLFVNAGTMTNNGFEMSGGYHFSLGPVRINLNANLSHVRNKITDLAGGLPIVSNNVSEFNTYLSETVEGESIASFKGYIVEGIYQSYEEIKNHLSEDASNYDPYLSGEADEPDPLRYVAPGDYKFRDKDNNKIIDEDDRDIIGSPLPDYIYGAGLNATYKAFDFSMNINGTQGIDVVNVMRVYLSSYDPSNKYSDYINNTWTPDNPDAKYPRMETDRNNNKRFSSAYVEDASYLKISNVTLGYTLPKNLLNNINIESGRIYFTVNNAYTFTKYITGYPEVGTSTGWSASPLDIGVDRGVYPIPRIFMIGANLSF